MLRKLAFVLLLAANCAEADERVLLLDDFDGGEKLSLRWTAIGSIGVQRVAAPAKVSVSGVGGMLSKCDAKANSKFLVNQRFKRPKYEDFDKIRFRIQVENASTDRPIAFEFQVFSQERRSALWRKFTVSSDEWQLVELPLEFFRFTTGASLDWREVSRFGDSFPSAVLRDAGRYRASRDFG